MTSFYDIMIVCSIILAEKPLCMHRRTTNSCMNTHQHPCPLTALTKSMKCCFVFEPIFVPVTYISTMITSFFLIIFHSHRCFQTNIYSLQNFFRHIINTTTIRVFTEISHHYHRDCRILADGMRICHLEHCYCLTSILGRRPGSNYPRHSLRIHLHHLLLDTHQPHTTSTI